MPMYELFLTYSGYAMLEAATAEGVARLARDYPTPEDMELREVDVYDQAGNFLGNFDETELDCLVEEREVPDYGPDTLEEARL